VATGVSYRDEVLDRQPTYIECKDCGRGAYRPEPVRHKKGCAVAAELRARKRAEAAGPVFIFGVGWR